MDAVAFFDVQVLVGSGVLYYGKSHVLHGVSLEVGPGEVVGLLGRNGVGKSTTLKTVMGPVRAAAGRIRFDGREVSGLAPHAIARRGIGWVPEDRRVFRLLTVFENLRTGLDRGSVGPERRDALLASSASGVSSQAVEPSAHGRRNV